MDKVHLNLRLIARRPRLAACVWLALTGVAGWGASHLSLKTNLKDLLPAHAASVLAMDELSQRVGGAQLVEVLLREPGGDAGRLKPLLPEIARGLEALPDVHKVEFRRERKFFDDNQLLVFPTLDQISRLRDEVKAELRRRVARELDPFSDEGGDDDDEDEDDDDDEWGGSGSGARPPAGAQARDAGNAPAGKDEPGDPLVRYRKARKEIDEELDNLKEYYLSYSGEYIALRVFPATPATDLESAQALVDGLDEAIPRILSGLGDRPGERNITHELYGDPVTALLTVRSIRSDVIASALSTVALLVLILLVAFRRVRPGPRWDGRVGAWLAGWAGALVGRLRVLVFIFSPLLAGIVWTLGVGSVTVGYLNLVSAFIFAILLGLGIDFGIHFLNRLLEERAKGAGLLEALTECQARTGRASITAALTTSAGFVCLILADFRGFSDLGLLAGVGVPFCVVSMYTVFPTLVILAERWRPMPVPPPSAPVSAGTGGRYPFARAVVLVTLAVAVWCATLLKDVAFEYDFSKVRLVTGDIEAIKQRTRGTAGGRGLGSNYVLYDSLDEAAEGHRLFQSMLKDKKRYSALRSYEGIFSFVPLDQDERLALLAEIRTLLDRKKGLFDGEDREAVDELIRLAGVKRITIEDLPAWLKSELRERPSADGAPGRVGLFGRARSRRPRGAKDEILAFSDQLSSIDLSTGRKQLAGSDLIKADVLRLIVTDGKTVMVLALLAVLLMMAADLRRPMAVVVAAAPLVVGVLWVGGLMALLDIRLDYFNVVALPAVLGIGVDSGIHLVHRFRESADEHVLDLLRHTGKGVMLATVTTMVGFSGLVGTSHLGLVSLGKLALLGFGSCLLAAFTVVPALLQWQRDRQGGAR